MRSHGTLHYQRSSEERFLTDIYMMLRTDIRHQFSNFSREDIIHPNFYSSPHHLHHASLRLSPPPPEV